MTQARIRSAFETRLATWAAARVPALPIVWEGVTTGMPTGDHLRAFLLPALTTSRDLQGLHRSYRGVFQVSIFCPPGTGSKKAEGIAAELDALFPAARRMTDSGFTVVVLTPMASASTVHEPDWDSIPVSCRYGADTF